MSSDLEAVSAILGEYMLKGWTLTAIHCPHCNTTPLMREPLRQAEAEGRGERGRVEFCARCQGGPPGEAGRGQAGVREVVEVRGVNGLVNGHGINGHGHGHDSDSDSEDQDEDDNEEVESISSDLERELQDFVPESYRRALAGENNGNTSASASGSRSTPAPGEEPTTSATSIPAQTTTTTTSTSTTPTISISPDLIQARRQQSDRASNLIGTLLLQGYSLLSKLCDNEGCYGIPLVGHPRGRATTTTTSGSGASARNAGTGRNAAGTGPRIGGRAGTSGIGGQKKECVICGKVWEADGTVSRESRGSARQPSAAIYRAAQGAGSDVRAAQAVRGAGSDVRAAQEVRATGAGSGSGQGQGRSDSTSMPTPTLQAGRMRDISREEAMRIYSGEVDVSSASKLGTGSADPVKAMAGNDDRAPPMIANCWAAEVGEDFIPISTDAAHARTTLDPDNNSATNPPAHAQLTLASTLNSTEQALLSTLEAINRTYLLKSNGPPAEFEKFISRGEVGKFVEASAEVMRGLQGVERMRGRMGLESRRTRERAREREERQRERDERRRWAWRNRDRDLERDFDRESYRETSVSPYVNEFGGRRYLFDD